MLVRPSAAFDADDALAAAGAAVPGPGARAAVVPGAAAAASGTTSIAMSRVRSIIGSAGVDVGRREEVRDLDRGVLQRIGTVHGVGVDRIGEDRKSVV